LSAATKERLDVSTSVAIVMKGCRDAEICRLDWEWEVAVPELGTTVFIIPGRQVKRLASVSEYELGMLAAPVGDHGAGEANEHHQAVLPIRRKDRRSSAGQQEVFSPLADAPGQYVLEK
jgi:hypothetical protein